MLKVTFLNEADESVTWWDHNRDLHEIELNEGKSIILRDEFEDTIYPWDNLIFAVRFKDSETYVKRALNEEEIEVDDFDRTFEIIQRLDEFFEPQPTDTYEGLKRRIENGLSFVETEVEAEKLLEIGVSIGVLNRTEDGNISVE